MTPIVLGLSLLVIFGTHFLGSVACYGSTLLAVPLLISVTGDLRASVLVLIAVATLQSYQILFYMHRCINRRVLLRIVILAGLGMPIGFACMQALPEKPLSLALALTLIAGGASSLAKPYGGKCSSGKVLPGMDALLPVGGVIHGAFASGGALLAVYARYCLRDKDEFRGTMCAVWVILNTALLVTYATRGQLWDAPPILMLSAVPTVALAVWLGQRCSERLSQEAFLRFVSLLLIVAGAVMMARVLGG